MGPRRISVGRDGRRNTLDLRNRINAPETKSTGHILEMEISQGGVWQRSRRRMLVSHHGEVPGALSAGGWGPWRQFT